MTNKNKKMFRITALELVTEKTIKKDFDEFKKKKQEMKK